MSATDWEGCLRVDGVEVFLSPARAQDGSEVWIATHPARLPLLLCPCCGAAFRSPRTAKLVADNVWPLQADPAEG